MAAAVLQVRQTQTERDKGNRDTDTDRERQRKQRHRHRQRATKETETQTQPHAATLRRVYASVCCYAASRYAVCGTQTAYCAESAYRATQYTVVSSHIMVGVCATEAGCGVCRRGRVCWGRCRRCTWLASSWATGPRGSAASPSA
eukprot:1227602-Rhodomonas_salina.1